MSKDYISTDTRSWVYGVFCKMSDDEFVTELRALESSRTNYLRGSDGLHNSFVLEYLDSVYEIARDFLVDRCIVQSPAVLAGLPPFSDTGVVKPLRRD